MQIFDKNLTQGCKVKEAIYGVFQDRRPPLPPCKCEIPYVPSPQHGILKLHNLLLDL